MNDHTHDLENALYDITTHYARRTGKEARA